MPRRLSILVSVALACAAPALARTPTPAEKALLGRYHVGDGVGRRLCSVVLSFEPSVGGELDATGCAKGAPELDDAVTWWVGEQDDGPSFADALRKTRAVFHDSEGGLIAGLDGDRVLTLEPVTRAFTANPGASVPGRWTYSNEGGDDPTGGCHVTLARGGAVMVAAKCPAALKASNGGRWSATASTVTLAKRAAKLRLDWGAADDHLFLPGGHFWLQREE